MNAKSLAPLMLSNTTVVIDINGEIRQLLPGEVPGPGEVIVVVGQGATAATEEAPADFGFEAQLVGDGGDNFSLDLDNEIASIIEQIEEGVDPTQNEDFATAAGGQDGSSLTGSGDIERTGAETLAETEFDTSGLELQGLSETQSLTLLEVVAQAIFVGDDAVTVFETDVPWAVTGTVEATETEFPTFVVQDNVAGDNGVFSIDAEGNWTYVANSAFDELNIGDSLVDVFSIESSDGTLGSVTVTINGTNDLPQFVATDDFAPGGGEGELSSFAFEDGVYSFDFEENSAAGTIVGQVEATDPDNQVLVFSISSNVENEGGEALFAIDSETGEISLTAAGAESFANDFEALSNVHNLVVTVTEGDGIGEPQSVDVDVVLTEIDVNEPPVFEPPVGGGGDYVFAYPENSEVGAVVGSVSASDPEDTIVSYSLDFTSDPTLDGLFSIDSEGTIRLTEAGAATFTNDFEWGDDNTHGITVIATDATGLSTEIDVVLNEGDVNEAPTSNEPDGGYVFEYAENSDTGTLLGTVSASDVDDGDTLTYSITTNVEVDGLPLYWIDETSGDIYLTDKGVDVFTNDFETDPNLHNIVVTAADSGGLTATINVSLQETDVNEAPTSNEPDGGYVFEYAENSDTGTLLGTVSASDVDDGDTLAYSITTNVEVDGLPLYRIDETSGEIYLTEKGVDVFTNDFETDPNLHNIVVTATDSGGLTATINVSLQETDVNEAPTSNEPDGGYVFEYAENSDTGTLLGTVSASDVDDGDTLTYSITTNVEVDGLPLYRIDETSGEIYLTDKGVDVFTNDFETAPNLHNIVVTATDSGGLTATINVSLQETDVNEAPVFNEPDGGYEFSYNENSTDSHVIGTVSATDEDVGDVVTYSISTNIAFGGEDLFEIDSESGAISLTTAGVSAFTNNFESLPNEHIITVAATDGELTTYVDVDLSELDVNELPVTEDFNVDAGDAIIVPIIFDSDDESLDHISDEDDDFNGIELNIMITSLPQYGTLLYTDDFGETRVVTEADLHVLGEEIDPSKLFDPDNFTYVPGVGDEFEMGHSGDPADIVLGEDGFYNWGEYVSDTERVITLENGNTIGVSITDNNDKPLKQYTGGPAHVGWGIGDTDGNGMNKQETLHINLSNNPLGVVVFGLDGMGGAFNTNSNVYVEVTYTLADGTTHVEQYQKDEGDTGNDQILYEFSYSSPDNPIVSMELTGSGGNWELRYLSGTEDITEDVTFDYVAVDSELAISNESTVTIDVDESPEYEVLSAELGDSLDADLGNQMMLGDENANIFTWLDSTLDNGTDVVDNFELGNDLIDVRGILEEDDNVIVGDLIDSISAVVDGDNVVMTVTDEGREQTIILEGVTSAFEDAGLIADNTITNELEMLTQILKTDAA